MYIYIIYLFNFVEQLIKTYDAGMSKRCNNYFTTTREQMYFKFFQITCYDIKLLTMA